VRADVRTVVFAAVFGTICALILTAASRLSAPYRTANAKAEEVRNYLSALGVPHDAQAPAAVLIGVFERNVQVRTNGAVSLYSYVPEGSADPAGYAVPFAGMGLWGPIKGVLALDPDLLTIRGLRFYQQEETPGLGGEIGTEAFVAQFNGKKIASADGRPGFRLVKKGFALDDNSVDAITGATMTCARVQDILRETAGKVATERSSRHGRE
jgi:Na(+)-translocating NADH:ubiquinone oxidoreductase C subunit